MESLEQIKPFQLKNFFVNLCAISRNYAKHHQAMEDLEAQSEKLKNQRFSAPEKSERFSHEKNRRKSEEPHLMGRIHQLEHELWQAKRERDMAMEENKRKIHELNIALLSIKANMEKFAENKKERQKRVRELERKINKKMR